MNIQRKLSKIGIEKLEELDKKDINYLAHFTADKITQIFPALDNFYNEILAKLLNCKMFYARIKENLAKVNYIYEDNCIYIDENINIFEPNEQIYHELIHYLQILKKKNGKIKQIGLCNFGDFSVSGLGINEALVQYMSSKLMERAKEKVNSLGLEIKTISPNTYPILTNLVEQLIYLLGEDEIILASINVENNFDDLFYNTFEEKGNLIIKNFDKILDCKNLILEVKSGNYKKETEQDLEKNIKKLYLDTQKILLTKYFDKIVSVLTSIEEIDFYSEKFLNYNKILGLNLDDRGEVLDFFNEYEQFIMNKFDKQLMKISKNKGKNTLSNYNSKIGRMLKKIFAKFGAN